MPLLWLWVGAEAQAQTGAGSPAPPRIDRSFDVQTFHPAVGAQSFITLDSAEVLEHRMWHFGLVTNYQRQPLSFTLGSPDDLRSSSTLSPVRDMAMAELVTAMGLLGRYEVGVALPLAVSWGGDAYDSFGRSTGTTSARVWGLGDLRVEGKGELVGFGRDRAFLLSLSAGGTLPTGDDSAFLGDRSVTGRARALLEYQRSERFRAVAMLGGLFRARSEFLGTPVSHAALFGGALEVKPNQQIGVLAELTGRFASKYADTNPIEADAAMRFYVPPMLSLIMGGGLGLNQGVGSPVVRAFVGLGWAPDYRDRDHDGIIDVYDLCPDEAEDRDGYKDTDGCPETDNDGDDIPDTVDKCPNEPEDFDHFQDDDGCPEADNDGDGIPDINDACPNEKEDGKGKRPSDGCPSTAEDSDGDGVSDPLDKCPDEPEDKDGFQDQDGCPDYDNDGDGVPDGYDACPNEPEDFDGFDDNDGCPDLDNDHDGVPDKKDRCPNQPETLNNFKDDDGCPDGPALVSLGEEDERVDLVEHINFYPGPGGKPALTTNSNMLIGLVARLLRSHPEVAKVRIDVRGKELTKESSEERAQVVLKALVKAGIADSRLKAAGLGAGPNRVELVIESRTRVLRAAPIPVVPSTDNAEQPAPEPPASEPPASETTVEPATDTPADGAASTPEGADGQGQ